MRHQDFSQKHRAVHRIVMDEILGVSPLLAKELCFRADLNPAEQASRLTAADWSKLDEVIVEFSTAVANGQGQPGLLSEDPEGNKLLDFHAYPIYSAPFFIKQGSLSEAMDHYYHDKLTKAGLEEKRQSLMRKIQNEYSGIKKLIAIHKEDIESTKDRDKDKEKGEFILANLHLAEPRAKELTGVDYYDPEMKERLWSSIRDFLLLIMQSAISSAMSGLEVAKKKPKTSRARRKRSALVRIFDDAA